MGQALVEAVPAVATALLPLAGAVLVLGPDASKFIYEATLKWKGKPSCNPQEQINRLMLTPKATLSDFDRISSAVSSSDFDRISSAVSSSGKYIASVFGVTGGWEQTGCNAVGVGRPVRDAQKSSDGFWTVDVALSELRIQDMVSASGRFIRLEILPGYASATSIDEHPATPNDVIGFSGPLVWDTDHDGEHPHGHMEMHPTASIQFFRVSQVNLSPPSTQSAVPTTTSSTVVGQSFVPLFPTTYTVVQGDCLATIAQRLYGRQAWRELFVANKKLIRNPHLIYPGQVLVLPPP